MSTRQGDCHEDLPAPDPSTFIEEFDPAASEKTFKYWAQRYRLFHKYDEGVRLDEEGWFSATPEKIARHIAKRFDGMRVVADLFSGPAGTMIQLAKNESTALVIGVENSRSRIETARVNSRVYGVEHKMEFVQADAYDMMGVLKKTGHGFIEGIFMSPPWGGPEYGGKSRKDAFDLSAFKEAILGALSITPNVAVMVPRTVDERQVFELFGECEVERNFLAGTLKAKTLYFGSLMLPVDKNSEVIALDGDAAARSWRSRVPQSSAGRTIEGRRGGRDGRSRRRPESSCGWRGQFRVPY